MHRIGNLKEQYRTSVFVEMIFYLNIIIYVNNAVTLSYIESNPPKLSNYTIQTIIIHKTVFDIYIFKINI